MKGEPRTQQVPRRALVPAGTDQLVSPWEPLPLETSVDRLGDIDLIAVRGTDYVVASVHRAYRRVADLDMVFLRLWRNGGDWPRHREREVPGYTTVESLVLARGLAPAGAFRLPELLWRTLLPPQVRHQGVKMSLAAAVARLPVLSAINPRAAAADRVAEVRVVYGQLLTDIAYRIENSALFDSTVPTTHQLETALALWAEVSMSTSDQEVIRHSAMVTVAFETARAHAETVGLGHLPFTARAAARRAAGAARLARSSTAAAEQEAARSRLTALLRSLALDFLPNPDSLPREITSDPRNTPAPRPARLGTTTTLRTP